MQCMSTRLGDRVWGQRLLQLLLKHKLINRHQHGFLSCKSTTTQLPECCLDWNIALNARSNIDIIYLDFSKAFDSVVHAKLIAKLACYGINDMLLYWIQSFLTDRFQYVKIDNSFSALIQS